MIKNDPFEWMEHVLNAPVELWDFQETMLRDRSPKKIYRCGRRVGKTLLLITEALWTALMNPSYKVLLVVPFDQNKEIMFHYIGEIMKNSTENYINRTKSFNEIYFKNNSVIQLLSTNSTNYESEITGLKADAIFIDDMEYIPHEKCVDILAVAAESPNTTIRIAFTPTPGKTSMCRSLYEDESNGYSKHFHPMTDRPDWNENCPAFYRDLLTPQEYKNEILAEFTDD